MHNNIEEIEFTIFDTETTGLDAGLGDRIVEIAGIRFRGRERIGTFQSLVNPQRAISPAAFAVNKISPQMLKYAPTIETVIPEFLSFIGDSYLCSYNAPFDLDFLNSELKRIDKDPLNDKVVIDILKMARRLLPGLERYALWFVTERLGIAGRQEHRALSDVELTLQVFYKLKEKLENKGIFDSMSLLSLFGLNSRFLENSNNQKIAEIQKAMDLGVKLKIKYLSSVNAEVSERQVIPKEIRRKKNNYYLVGYCCLRNEERTFRIDGVLHLEIV